MPFRVRTKLLSVVAVGFLLTFLSSYLIFNYMYGRYMEGTILERVREAEYAWHEHEKMDTDTLSAALRVFLGDKEFKEVFKGGDRERVYEFGQPLFRDLKERYGITHFYFHLPDGTNFVRLHNKEMHGDKVERFTFRKAQSTGDLASGIELGKTAFAFRVVAPYHDKERLIGYVEFGQEIDHFLNLLKGETKNEFAIIARKEFMNREDWGSLRKAAGLPDNWDDLKNYLWISRPLDHAAKGCFAEENLKEFEKGAFFVRGFRDEGFACGGFPLHDASGKSAGVVMAVIDISKHAALLSRVRLYASVLFLAIFTFTFFLTGLFIGHSFVRPIESISKVVHDFGRGDLTSRVKIRSKDEIGHLADTINDMSSEIYNLYSNLERMVGDRTKELTGLNKRLELLSITDGLTGLYNHRHFYMRLEEEVKRAERYGHPISLIISDIDLFKHYNDTHGHPAGDAILKGVAACLKGNAREHDLVARYGGEEFTIILPETGKDAAMMLAERIRQIISEQPFPKKETQPGGNLTMSFGVATFPVDASDLNGLVDRADSALYRAKEGGRNRVEAA